MATHTRTLSLRRNIVWSLGGNGVYNLVQWVLLVALARLANAELVGQFALALAITAPVFLTAGLNLRVVQATDAERVWRLLDYLRLKHLLNLAATACTLAVGLILGMRGEAMLVLLVMSTAKSVEAVSKTYYGYFQLRERQDFVARSMLTRSALGAALFVTAIALSGRLALACAGLLVGWLVTLLTVDRQSARRLARTDEGYVASREFDWFSMWRLARKASPLGLDQGVSSLSINIPRYTVELLLGTAKLGAFAALAYLAQVISMVTSSVSTTVLPRLAVYYRARRRRGFLRLLALLTLLGLGITAVATAGAVVLGGPFIRWTLGPEYVDVPLLVALMLSAGLTTLQRNLGVGLQAAHRYKAYLGVDLLTAATIAVSAPLLVFRYGLLGAAASLSVGFGVGIIGAWVVLADAIRRLPGQPLVSTSQPNVGFRSGSAGGPAGAMPQSSSDPRRES